MDIGRPLAYPHLTTFYFFTKSLLHTFISGQIGKETVLHNCKQFHECLLILCFNEVCFSANVLSDCDSNCPLDAFFNLTKDIIPDNWNMECYQFHSVTFAKSKQF